MRVRLAGISWLYRTKVLVNFHVKITGEKVDEQDRCDSFLKDTEQLTNGQFAAWTSIGHG